MFCHPNNYNYSEATIFNITQTVSTTYYGIVVICLIGGIATVDNLTLLIIVGTSVRKRLLPWRRYAYILSNASGDFLYSLLSFGTTTFVLVHFKSVLFGMPFVSIMMRFLGGLALVICLNGHLSSMNMRIAIQDPFAYTQITKKQVVVRIVIVWLMGCTMTLTLRVIPTYLHECGQVCGTILLYVELGLMIVLTAMCIFDTIATVHTIRGRSAHVRRLTANDRNDDSTENVPLDSRNSQSAKIEQRNNHRNLRKVIFTLFPNLLVLELVVCIYATCLIYIIQTKEFIEAFTLPVGCDGVIHFVIKVNESGTLAFNLQLITAAMGIWLVRAMHDPFNLLVRDTAIRNIIKTRILKIH